jgi:hypothetical protein
MRHPKRTMVEIVSRAYISRHVSNFPANPLPATAAWRWHMASARIRHRCPRDSFADAQLAFDRMGDCARSLAHARLLVGCGSGTRTGLKSLLGRAVSASRQWPEKGFDEAAALRSRSFARRRDAWWGSAFTTLLVRFRGVAVIARHTAALVPVENNPQQSMSPG